MHTILATHLQSQVPRWADEGSAILEEHPKERKRYRTTCQACRGTGRLIPLARLFTLSSYPRDVTAFYAQSASVTEFLVGLKDRKTFLAFLKSGKENAWDKAVKQHYGLAGVAELEKRWLRALGAAVK